MYAELNSPLPGLTVSPTGERCCGMRGAFLGMLGQDPIAFDTTSTDVTGGLIAPDNPAPPIIDLGPPAPIDMPVLPLPNQLSPSLETMYPATVGNEFTSNGDGTYTNIQTGQTVPYTIAEQITAATSGTATANLQTTATGQGQDINITDPNSGVTNTVNTNNLSVAAQGLQAAGQLVTAAGKLTTQGQTLLNGGNLYKTPSTTSPFGNISGAMSSLTSWFTGSTMIPGLPNMVIIGGIVAAAFILPAMMSGKKRKR
jgi:hypothetical protein